MKTELLAPAKDKETAFEAINCGADAVYIGASAFGARQNAGNSLEDISEVIEYAHKYRAKVFVTVNTILKDSELNDAVELVKTLDKMNADAVLVQDMGLLYKLIELKLDIPIHMSTQCDNRLPEKIAFFNKLCVSRVVLARELSIEQIKKIHKENPNLELESFIHGALCVSYSGQCYLSQYIGGRSANRGECAQPCRKKYTVKTTDGEIVAKDIYALCLKDFNASEHIKSLIDAGVFSFKIEGRLKDKGYVKNVVSFYRQELDKYSEKISSGSSIYPFVPDVEKSFNRGFTDYFLDGRKDCYNFVSPKSMGKYIGKVSKISNDYMELNTKVSISAQDGLCYEQDGELKGFLVNKVLGDKIYPNRSLDIKIGTKIYRNQDIIFEKELSKPVKRQIGININIWENKIAIVDEDNVSITIELPNGEPAKNQEKMNETFIKQFTKTGESIFYVKDIKINTKIPFLPVSEINQLRRDAFEKLTNERLKQYKREVQKPMHLAKYFEDEVDYRANVHNKTAQKFYEECGCRVKEYSLETNIPQRTVEIMRTKHCIKYALNMCKSPKNLVLKDDYGTEYPLKFDCKNCEMAVLSP